jgi:hypothetical protein
LGDCRHGKLRQNQRQAGDQSGRGAEDMAHGSLLSKVTVPALS